MKINIVPFLKLFRPHHYVKNLFIFMPLFFAGQIADYQLLFKAAIAFVSFSLTASALYIFNDIQDIDEDRLHPVKKNRPLASGEVSHKSGLVAACLLIVAGAALMMSLSVKAFLTLGVYAALNVGYSYYFKHIALIDVTIISIGFVLRLLVGSNVTGICLSEWIVILTFLLAQFLALAKRRDDLVIFLDTGIKIRKVTDGYNLKLIDSLMVIMASVVIVSYILYSTSVEVVERLQSDYLYVTVLFVILGIMRYMQITYMEKNSGSPTRVVLKDIFMQVIICSWLITHGLIIYS